MSGVSHESVFFFRYLVKHVTRVHSKEKEDRTPLECAICGKCFPRLSHLQRHQLIHIKEREWGCPFCEQSFVQKVSAFLMCGLITSVILRIDSRLNRHRSLKCRNCGETFDGYASLRAHELRQRSHAHVCSCGASFTREPELAHRDSCRKRGSFLCLVCERVFTQRIQLDRHWNKEHFSNAQCEECGWIAAAPLRKAEHALDVHKKRVCGYCDAEDPADDHVSAEHWKRLRKSIPVQKPNKKPLRHAFIQDVAIFTRLIAKNPVCMEYTHTYQRYKHKYFRFTFKQAVFTLPIK
ncbi:unnamed protein product [Heligmosomoides polygyrus]|uniref:C2H2-type domain-containing protein n=1 Tax=Heligmosomoides polygyrus TaxID=6339 RepID=A0A3P8BXJ5_HELPZ|nr:unnamed protein product [Heligmosomoides polygyrus]